MDDPGVYAYDGARGEGDAVGEGETRGGDDALHDVADYGVDAETLLDAGVEVGEAF